MTINPDPIPSATARNLSEEGNEAKVEVANGAEATTVKEEVKEDKTKKRGSGAMASELKEAEDVKSKKKVKKPRVKHEKVKEVYNKLVEQLKSNYEIGMTEVPLDTLAAAIGYKHPRSDAIADAMKLLVKDGVVEKTRGICKFTSAGVKEHAPEETPASNPEEAMQRFWDHFQTKLASLANGKGAKCQEASKAVWDKLKDGKAYSKKELVKTTSYAMERSSGFEAIIKALNQLKFLDKVDGKVEFAPKLFPFGRP